MSIVQVNASPPRLHRHCLAGNANIFICYFLALILPKTRKFQVEQHKQHLSLSFASPPQFQQIYKTKCQETARMYTELTTRVAVVEAQSQAPVAAREGEASR